MKLLRSVLFSVSLSGLSIAAVACGGTVEHAPQTSAGLTKAPVGANTHGFVKVFGEALGEVPLRPEQRAEIEKLATEADARHAPTAEGRKELMLAFADQVEKGTIDKAALQPKIDRVTADFEKIRAEDRAALNKLHAILDAEQRGAFVDALESRMKGKHGEHSRGRMEGFGKLKQLAEDLKLTDAQKSQIRDALRDAHEHGREHGKGHGPWKGRGHGKHPLEAFRGESFDLDKVAPQHDADKARPMGAFGVERMSAMAEKILPILTPEQRKIAADKLRAMAAKGDAALLEH